MSEPALHLSSCFWVVFVAPLTVLAPFPCLLASFWCLLAHALLGRRRGAAGRRPGRSPGAQGRLGRVFGRSRGALGVPKCTFGLFFKSPFFIIFGSLFWTVFGARPGPPRGAPKALPGPLGGTRWAHGQKTLLKPTFFDVLQMRSGRPRGVPGSPGGAQVGAASPLGARRGPFGCLFGVVFGAFSWLCLAAARFFRPAPAKVDIRHFRVFGSSARAPPAGPMLKKPIKTLCFSCFPKGAGERPGGARPSLVPLRLLEKFYFWSILGPLLGPCWLRISVLFGSNSRSGFGARPGALRGAPGVLLGRPPPRCRVEEQEEDEDDEGEEEEDQDDDEERS